MLSNASLKYPKEIESAFRLAQLAGKEILKIYHRGFKTEFKELDDPITEADRLANGLIVDALRKEFPDDEVVGEENDLTQATWIGKNRIWYVDPIDGTREFVARRPQFVVMIGLAVNGHAELGIVYNPLTEVIYSGIVGEGASRVELNGPTAKLKRPTHPGQILRLAQSRAHHSEKIDLMLTQLNIGGKIVSGSFGVKVGMIADNLADLYIDVSGKTSAWDSCGPEAILRAAGGELTNLKGERITYGQRELRNLSGIVASGHQAQHADIIRKIRPFI